MKRNLIFSLPKPFGGSALPERLRQRVIILALSREGVGQSTIAMFTAIHPKTVQRWARRLQNDCILCDARRSGRPRLYSEKARLKAIAVYCQQTPPLPGVHQWSLRDASAYFKEHPEILGGPLSRSTMQRILLDHALRPHRSKYYLQITDPDFFPKMEHIIDCYSAALPNLYCFDECTCIQALKRYTPTLPPASGQPALEDFDYIRNGTTDLLAFLNPATGQVYGQCTDNHDRHTLCQVFASHIQMHPPEETIHYIMDNFSAHYHDDFCRLVADLSGVEYLPLKTGVERRQWLQSDHKRIVIHFVPFHASWLNMVEIWFGILKNKCLKYNHFFSVAQLREAMMSFIDTWNAYYAHPFQWSYTGEGLHGQAVRRFSRLLFIETEQMDGKFLMSQLLLMSNIANHYLHEIEISDWHHLQSLAREKKDYILRIIETDDKPRRQKKAKEAYRKFDQEVMGNQNEDESALAA